MSEVEYLIVMSKLCEQALIKLSYQFFSLLRNIVVNTGVSSCKIFHHFFLLFEDPVIENLDHLES